MEGELKQNQESGFPGAWLGMLWGKDQDHQGFQGPLKDVL